MVNAAKAEKNNQMVYGESLSTNKGQSATNKEDYMRLSFENFVKKVKAKYPNELFEILEYNGTSKSGTYYCGLCKKEYFLGRMGKLLAEPRKHICSYCWASSYTQEILGYFPLDNLEFERLGYNHTLHKPTVIYKCKICDSLNEKPFTEFIKYPTCIHCGTNTKRRNTEGLNLILPEEFEILEEYKGQCNKILFRHKCGFIFKIRPKDLITGHSYCPKCSRKASRGEQKIMDFLISKDIHFIKGKEFDWSQRKRYDFYLPDFNLLIEYHGKQHYEEVPTFKVPLKEQQEIDALKLDLAISHGFNYLTISYKNFDNVEEILAQRLSLAGVGKIPK